MAYLSDYLGGGVGLSTTPLGSVLSNVLGPGVNFQPTKTAVARAAYPALSTAFPNASSVAYEATVQTLPSVQAWSACAYGNGVYVAATQTSGVIAISYNGVTWMESILINPASVITAIAYGNGVFVALDSSSNTRAYSSPDGITWTARTLPVAINWSAIIYANNQFVAVSAGSSSSNVAATSPDGITWTARTLPTSATWGSIAYGNGVYLAVAGWSGNSTTSSGNSTTSNVAATSPDGITWTAQTLPNSSFGTSVAFGNGVFVVVAGGGTPYAATSPDGSVFTASAGFASPSTDLQINFGNGAFFVLPQNATAGTAGLGFDGDAWTSLALPGSYSSACFGNGQFLAVNSSTATGTAALLVWLRSVFSNQYVYLAGTAGQLVRVM